MKKSIASTVFHQRRSGAFSGIIIAALIVITIINITGCSKNLPPKLKAGVGETIITPRTNDVPMRGYAARKSTGVHDDLYARSLVLEGGDGTSVVLMTLSLCNLNFPFEQKIRENITGQTGIPGKNIIISCTHTHSGPYVEQTDEEYQAFLLERSVKSAVDAWNRRVPARIGSGSATVLGLGMNDRRMLHGGLHPDPEVGILKIEDADGMLMGVAFNFGCHPSTLDLHNLEFTEDWPYYSITGLKEKLGGDIWAAYYQSAQGDVKVGYTAELSAVGADMGGLRSFWWAEYKGRMMVDPVCAALDTITTDGDPVIRAAMQTMDFPRRNTYPVTVEEALANQKAAHAKLAEMEKKADFIGRRQLDFYRVDVFLADQIVGGARRFANTPNPEPITGVWQQAVLIGDAAIVTFPCEIFSEIGKTVKDRSPLDKTFVIGLAAGMGGYMPTSAEYPEGGYAVNNSPFSPESEGILVDYSVNLIRRINQ